jgi:L-amino acid N-acyltransferase
MGKLQESVTFLGCNYPEHGQAILEIFNEAIINSTALYDYQPRSMANMVEWFANKTTNNFPVIGAMNDDGELLGFASYGVFRQWPAYKYTVEHSLYVHAQHRGQGIGQALLEQLITTAIDRQYHTLIGGIDSSNQASINLHQKLGFRHCGTIDQAGFKFGRWLNLSFYQLLLPTPGQPIDG